MSKTSESSVFDAAEPADPNSQTQVLRNRSGDATDASEAAKVTINETTIEAADSPGGNVEYVKGHPVIKNGKIHNHQSTCGIQLTLNDHDR